MTSDEKRREYQRQYYLAHKDKAREYQREYNRTHKRQRPGKKHSRFFKRERAQVKQTYNIADLLHAPVEKTLKMLNQICAGARGFVV